MGWLQDGMIFGAYLYIYIYMYIYIYNMNSCWLHPNIVYRKMEKLILDVPGRIYTWNCLRRELRLIDEGMSCHRNFSGQFRGWILEPFYGRSTDRRWFLSGWNNIRNLLTQTRRSSPYHNIFECQDWVAELMWVLLNGTLWTWPKMLNVSTTWCNP